MVVALDWIDVLSGALIAYAIVALGIVTYGLWKGY